MVKINLKSNGNLVGKCGDKGLARGEVNKEFHHETRFLTYARIEPCNISIRTHRIEWQTWFWEKVRITRLEDEKLFFGRAESEFGDKSMLMTADSGKAIHNYSTNVHTHTNKNYVINFVDEI